MANGPQGSKTDPTGPAGPVGPAPTKENLQQTFTPTEGWYVAGACAVGIMTANTRVGSLVFGVLTIALIFQLSLLLQGK